MAADPAIGRADAGGRAVSSPQVQAAVHDLFERHGQRVLAYCRRRLRSPEEAEDALQTTFLYACRGLQRGVVPETEIAWLLKIAHNVCLSQWDSDRRRRRLELVQDPDRIDAATPAAAASDRENVIALETALGSLTELQRRAILLREWRGLSYQEIAAELKLSASAVETLLFRARRSLARGLDRQDVGRPRTLARCLDLGGLLSALKSALGLSGNVKVAAGLVGAALLAGSIPDVPERAAPVRPKAAPAAQASAPAVIADPATTPAARAAVAKAAQDRRTTARAQRPERRTKKEPWSGEAGEAAAVGKTLDEAVQGVTGAVSETVRGVTETVDETLPEIVPPVPDLVGDVVGGGGSGLLP